MPSDVAELESNGLWVALCLLIVAGLTLALLLRVFRWSNRITDAIVSETRRKGDLLLWNEWINERAAEDPNWRGGYGRCKEVCEAMRKDFPALEIRCGIFHSMQWGERQHYWLRAPDGTIVDPTGEQHPDGSRFSRDDERYEDLTDMDRESLIKGGKVPIGKCMECGSPVYWSEHGHSDFCNDACYNAFAASLGM